VLGPSKVLIVDELALFAVVALPWRIDMPVPAHLGLVVFVGLP
jgi:hypothetical protein